MFKFIFILQTVFCRLNGLCMYVYIYIYVCVYIHMCVCVCVYIYIYLTLCDLMDCSLPFSLIIVELVRNDQKYIYQKLPNFRYLSTTFLSTYKTKELVRIVIRKYFKHGIPKRVGNTEGSA